MKKELKKRIKKLCDDIGTSAAAEELDELTEQMTEEFDRRIAEGESELDAYREILSNTEKIKEMLKALSTTEEEESRREKEKSSKKLRYLLNTIESALWLLTVIIYFAFSITFGYWHLTWLIFLVGAMGSILFGMAKDYNKGKPLRKVISEGFSGLLWLSIVIIYFVFSFTFGHWSLTWLIFVAGAMIEVIKDGIVKSFGGE